MGEQWLALDLLGHQPQDFDSPVNCPAQVSSTHPWSNSKGLGLREQKPGKGAEGLLLGPLGWTHNPEVCPDCSGLLLATRRVTWAGPWQKQLLCARLVEVRESLTQIRRKQALQDSERKGTEQEANLR